MISLDSLKKELKYDPETGFFIRLKNLPGQYKVGDIAGGLSKEKYVLIRVCSKQYKAHRLAWLYMTGEILDEFTCIDHINGNRADNSWKNLRLASKTENGTNRGKSKNNTSGFKGIHIEKGNRPRVLASFIYEGVSYKKAIRLGYKKSEKEAIDILREWLKETKKKVQGDFYYNE